MTRVQHQHGFTTAEYLQGLTSAIWTWARKRIFATHVFSQEFAPWHCYIVKSITCPYHSFGLRMLETIPPRSTTESNRRNIFREWYPVHRVMQMMSSSNRTDLSRVDWNIKYAAFLFLHLLNLPTSWGGDQPWIWKQRSEGRGWRDKGRTHRCWRQGWGRGMAGPKCLNLNRMLIPAFSGTDAVRIGTGWWQCPERQAEEEEEGQKYIVEIGWIRWRSCPARLVSVIIIGICNIVICCVILREIKTMLRMLCRFGMTWEGAC